MTQCKTCPFITHPDMAHECAYELATGNPDNILVLDPHPCLEVIDVLRAAKSNEPVCTGHANWLKTNAPNKQLLPNVKAKP